VSSLIRRFKAAVVVAIAVSLLTVVASPATTSATASEAIAGSFAAAAQKTFGTGNTHKCVIDSVGSIQCWGSNQSGQLGQGGAANTPASAPASDPLTVTGLSGKTFSQISTGNSVTCAVESTNGEVWCWGLNNQQGIVGGGSLGATHETTPVQVKNGSGGSDYLTDVKEVDVDVQHACALTNGGQVWCWGQNNGGRLGTGSGTPAISGTALKIVNSDATALSVGRDSACIINTTGGVECWGHNVNGQIGNNGGASYNYTPSQVTGLTEGVRAISVGESNACALLPNNVVKCWGQNLFGAIGDGTFANTRTTPVEVLNPPADIVTISMNYGRAVVLTATGKIFYWGGDDTRYIAPTEWNPVTGGTYFALSASRTGAFESCYLVKLNNVLSVRCAGDTPNVNMSITTAPAPPTITVEPGDAQATITVAPGNGGGPVESFVVTAQPGGATCTVTPPDTSCVISGLTNGTAYTFEAISKNPAGDSASSASVDSTPTSSGGDTTGGDTTGGDTSGGGTTGGGTTNDGATIGSTLSPGDVNATVDGKPVDIEITTSTDGQVTITGSDFSLTFNSPTSGNNNELFLPQGGTVAFNGDGYKPNSEITSSLKTANTNLGNAKVTRGGTFSSKLSVPRTTRSGNHQLTVRGTTKTGATRSIEIGVKVARLKKTTVKTFRVYATNMRPKLRRQSNRIVNQRPIAVHCQGFVRPSKINNPKDIARATMRAKSVCNYLKKREKGIHTTIGFAASTQIRRRVEVSYR